VAKKKTEGQRLMDKAQIDLEWAARIFDESATPEAVDINCLVGNVRAALEARKIERANGK